MKKLLLAVCLLFSLASMSQKKQPYTQYGGTWERLFVKKGLAIPTSPISTKDLNDPAFDTAQIYYNPVDSTVNVWSGTQWLPLGGGGSSRFAVTGEDDEADANRTFDLNGFDFTYTAGGNFTYNTGIDKVFEVYGGIYNFLSINHSTSGSSFFANATTNGVNSTNLTLYSEGLDESEFANLSVIGVDFNVHFNMDRDDGYLVETQRGGRVSTFEVRGDSILFYPHLGRINIDSLRTGTSSDEIITWNAGMVRKVSGSSLFTDLNMAEDDLTQPADRNYSGGGFNYYWNNTGDWEFSPASGKDFRWYGGGTGASVEFDFGSTSASFSIYRGAGLMLGLDVNEAQLWSPDGNNSVRLFNTYIELNKTTGASDQRIYMAEGLIDILSEDATGANFAQITMSGDMQLFGMKGINLFAIDSLEFTPVTSGLNPGIMYIDNLPQRDTATYVLGLEIMGYNNSNSNPRYRAVLQNKSALGGGTDLNFLEDNLTQDANRTHTQSTFTVTMNGSTTATQFEVINSTNGTAIKGQNAGNNGAVWGETTTGQSFVAIAGENAELFDGTGTQSNTTTIRTLTNMTLNSSGTPDDGFGQQHNYLLETSTTTFTTAARDIIYWFEATHASRTSYRNFNGINSATEEVFLQMQPDWMLVNNLADTLATMAYARSVGGGGGGSGTVNTGAQFKAAYYPSAGTTVDDWAGLSLGQSGINTEIIQQATSDVALRITAASSSAEDLLQFKNSGGTTIAYVDENAYAKFARVGINDDPDYRFHVDLSGNAASDEAFFQMGNAGTGNGVITMQGGGAGNMYIGITDNIYGSFNGVNLTEFSITGLSSPLILQSQSKVEIRVGGNLTERRMRFDHDSAQIWLGRNHSSAEDFFWKHEHMVGTNVAGGNVYYSTIPGTGDATGGGDFILLTPDAGSSGTGFQSVTEKLRVTRTGVLKLATVVQDDTETKVLVWNSTDDDVQWRDASTLGGGGGANTALSNLAAVAINTSLLPGTDDAIDLGSPSKQWRDLYMTGASIYMNGTKTLSSAGLDLPTGGGIRTRTGAGNTVLLQAYDVDGTAYVTFGTLTANNAPSFNLETSVTVGGDPILTTVAAAATYQPLDADLTIWAGITPGTGVGTALAIAANGSGGFVTDNGTVTLSNKTLTAPRISNGGFIADANGNELIIFTTTTSAVNEVTFANAATGNFPRWTASGETNVGIEWAPKGTGTFNFIATTSNATKIRVYEDADNGSNYIELNAPTTLTNNFTATIPTLTANDIFVTEAFAQTLTNKTFNWANNTVSMTTAQANTALSDNDFATLAGTETLSGKTLTAPRFVSTGFIADNNGNELIIFTTTASAVNEVTFANGATGVNPRWTASGETNVGIDWMVKGTGVYRFLASASGPTDKRWFEDSDNGSNYVSLIAPSTLSGDVVLTLPSTTGTIPVMSQIKGVKSATIASPTASENVTLFFTAAAITITNVTTVMLGTSQDITFTLNYGDSRATADGTIVANNQFNSSDAGYQTTGFAATLNTTSIPAGTYIWLVTTATSGTITDFNISIEYTLQ